MCRQLSELRVTLSEWARQFDPARLLASEAQSVVADAAAHSASDPALPVIGLIGGLSFESSAEYYRLINEGVRARLGGVRSARCLMWSFDFGEIETLQRAGDWDQATKLMIDAARRLQNGGADFFLICSNTMHRMADAIAAAVDIPLLHIADPTGERIAASGFKRVGLLGTAFTMEQEFYKGRLEKRFGLDVLVPDSDDRRASPATHPQRDRHLPELP